MSEIIKTANEKKIIKTDENRSQSHELKVKDTVNVIRSGEVKAVFSHSVAGRAEKQEDLKSSKSQSRIAGRIRLRSPGTAGYGLRKPALGKSERAWSVSSREDTTAYIKARSGRSTAQESNHAEKPRSGPLPKTGVSRPTRPSGMRYAGQGGRDRIVIGGAAGSAVSVENAAPVARVMDETDDAALPAGIIIIPARDRARLAILPVRSRIYARQLQMRREALKKRGKTLPAQAAGQVTRSYEAVTSAIASGNDDANYLAKEKAKYSFRGAVHLAHGAAYGVRGTYRFAKHSVLTYKDLKSGALTGAEAVKGTAKQLGGGAWRSGVGIGKAVGKEANEFLSTYGGGTTDPGMQVITQTRDAVYTAYHGARTAAAMPGAVYRTTTKTVKHTYRAVQKTYRAARRTASAVRAAPAVIKQAVAKAAASAAASGSVIALPVLLPVILLMIIVVAITAIIPNFSLKAEDTVLTDTYNLVTRLDAEKTREIHDATIGYDVVKFIFNGFDTGTSSVRIQTDADLMLLFLDAVYQDYDKTIAAAIVEGIHKDLHSISIYTWVESDEESTTSYIKVYIHSKTLAEYINTLPLTTAQKESMAMLKEVGQYAALQNLSSPFEDPWYVIKRFGHHYDGRVSEYKAMDIAMAAGTPVYSSMEGTVSTGNGSVTITSEDGKREFTVSYLGSVAVSQGEEISRGTVIGTVGRAQSPACIQVQYKRNNRYLNPAFYLRGNASGGGSGSAMGDGTYAALIAEAEKYLGYPYVFGGSSPETSFDCSGFVCWVYTKSGVYNLPRTTATGVYYQCDFIADEADARPGDLVFFEGTYNSGNLLSHIGIYVGNGMMLHCGDPIGYTSIHTSYWQQHLFGFGRLPVDE